MLDEQKRRVARRLYEGQEFDPDFLAINRLTPRMVRILELQPDVQAEVGRLYLWNFRKMVFSGGVAAAKTLMESLIKTDIKEEARIRAAQELIRQFNAQAPTEPMQAPEPELTDAERAMLDRINSKDEVLASYNETLQPIGDEGEVDNVR